MEKWKNVLKKDPVPWLLDSNPWTKYRTLKDLLDISDTDPAVRDAREKLINNQQVQALALDTIDWISKAPGRNNDPSISYFKLRMLADFGLKYTDLDLEETVKKATVHIVENMFAIRGVEPEPVKKGEKYVKPDPTIDAWHVSPCNAPMISYTLLSLGVENELLEKSIEELKTRWKEKSGWFCHYFFVESQFKKLHVGCPMAGLMALEVFSKVPSLKESDYARRAFEPIKFHRDFGKTLYYFGRSKKFWTFKYPFVWYNALYLGEVLSRFDFLKKEPMLEEIVEWIIDSQSEEGSFKPSSMFRVHKEWEFANKKTPSPWITFLCCRILKNTYV